jgi:hypothetical protein
MSQAYSNFHALSADELHAPHNVLLHLHQLGELLAQLGATEASTAKTN